MNPRLFALKLVYSALGIEISVDDAETKIQLQKAVYLSQRMGVDLGYRFAWLDRGPYCSELAEDYHKLAYHAGELEADVALKKVAIRTLSHLKRTIESIPDGLDVTQWMELLASLDFLRFVSRYGEPDVEKVLRSEKRPLVGYKDKASEALTIIRLGLAR